MRSISQSHLRYLGCNCLGFAPFKPFGSYVALYFVSELYKFIGAHVFRGFRISFASFAFHAHNSYFFIYKSFGENVSSGKEVLGKLLLA